MGDAISALLASRKALVLFLDTGVSIILYFVGRFLPGAADDIKFLIGALQPVALMLIYAIAKEDAAAKSAGYVVGPAPKYELAEDSEPASQGLPY